MPKKSTTNMRANTDLTPIVVEAIRELKIDVPIMHVRRENNEIILSLYGGRVVTYPIKPKPLTPVS
jgi:hypothetical protein